MSRRDVPEINAGSMADIAFLLLIFFLVTTTMDSSYGIQRMLPEYMEDIPPDDVKIKTRELLVALVNDDNELLVTVGGEKKPLEIEELKEIVKVFAKNESNDPNLPKLKSLSKADVDAKVVAAEIALKDAKGEEEIEKKEKALEKVRIEQRACELMEGDFNYARGIISLQNTNGTSYETYLAVNDQIAMAYYELRNEIAVAKYGKPLNKFKAKDSDEDFITKEALEFIYKSQVSEAETVDTGE